ncbi:MAG: hypothetical protein IKS48_09110 [Eubacterium sp.]|nr:hypothetical protein [Eubacterium sp.]
MRTDLKVNFMALADLSYHLKKYQGEVEDVEKELGKLNLFLDGQESKALKKLKENINEDDEYFLNLIEELKDLTKKIDSYVTCMENYVAAETPGEITRVDTRDIKANLKSMSRSVTSNNYWFDKTLPSCSYTFTGDKTKQLEQKKKYERNYNKLENFRRDYLVPLNKKLDQGIQDLFKIYSDYIEPFEKEDDIHRKNLDKSYKKYTSKKNKIKNGVNFSLKIRSSFKKHFTVAMLVGLAVLLLPTTVLVIGGIAVVAGCAAIAAIPEENFGGGLLNRIKVSVDEKVNIVKQGPVKVAKVIANDFADTVQTPEGVAGVVGDVAGMVVGGKIAKAIKIPKTPVSKTGEVDIPIEDVKAPGEVNTKPVDKLKDTVDDIKTKTDIESKTPEVGDVGKVDGGSDFKPSKIYYDKQGNLTNGIYTLNDKDMLIHKNGTLGKSQFLSDVDAEKAVLDAAEYADKYNLWETNTGNPNDFACKAKVYVENGPVGVTGDGKLTNYINVYRTKTGQVHGCPGN